MEHFVSALYPHFSRREGRFALAPARSLHATLAGIPPWI